MFHVTYFRLAMCWSCKHQQAFCVLAVLSTTLIRRRPLAIWLFVTVRVFSLIVVELCARLSSSNAEQLCGGADAAKRAVKRC